MLYWHSKGGNNVRERYHLIDSLRGLAVVNMVCYHFLFDVYILQGLNPTWRSIPGIHIWQQGICWTFLLVSGLSFHLGKRHWRNGLIISACGVLVTAVTLVAAPEEAIWFGVLTLLGAALLIAALLRPVLERIPAPAGAAGSFLLFLLTRSLQQKVIALGPFVLCSVPDVLYQRGILTFLGFPGTGFYSSDYFPLFPWLFLYLTGYFLGRLLLRRPPNWLNRSVPGLDWLGRHSLLIYLIHQPVAMLLSMAVALLS